MERVAEDSGKILFPVSIALLVVGILSGLALLPRVFQPTIRDAPDIAFHFVRNAPDGKADLRLSELRGRPVMLDFWATWCGPCKAEAPVLDKVARRFADRGLLVVGVNTSDEEGNAEMWAARQGLSYPIAFDEGNQAAKAYGVDGLPTLVLVSKTGKITAVRTGLTDDSELERLVKQAL